MPQNSINTYIVHGFIGAGKTTYIMDCLKNDFFYKRGKTLILAFEEGECEYDEALLSKRNTVVEFFCHSNDAPTPMEIADFCYTAIDRHNPDRIYIEMNAMIADLRTMFPNSLRIVFETTLIDSTTLSLYLTNMRAMVQSMVIHSHVVIFNRCTSVEQLSPYAQIFQVMNQKASYLREDPAGYHEKAFGIFLPFDLSAAEISLSDSDYVPFCLDGMASPQHYEGKILHCICQTDVDDSMAPIPAVGNSQEQASFKVGRKVMTCCLADIQFMGFLCQNNSGKEISNHAWIDLAAKGYLYQDEYHQTRLGLDVLDLTYTSAPNPELIVP